MSTKKNCAKVIATDTANDLADIVEVIYALAELSGMGRAALEGERQRKTKERGSFTKRIILEES